MLGIYSCRKVAELICHEEEGQLNMLQRMNFRLHLYICKRCQAYHSDMFQLRLAIKSILEKNCKISQQELEYLEEKILAGIK